MCSIVKGVYQLVRYGLNWDYSFNLVGSVFDMPVTITYTIDILVISFICYGAEHCYSCALTDLFLESENPVSTLFPATTNTIAAINFPIRWWVSQLPSVLCVVFLQTQPRAHALQSLLDPSAIPLNAVL